MADLKRLLEDASNETSSKYTLRSVDSIEEEIRTSLLKLLERGGKSKAALRDALVAKEYQPELIDQLLQRFVEVGLIDDFTLAKDIALDLANRKSKSKKLIAIELKQKGFETDAIQAALAELDQDRELEQARELAVSKMQRMLSMEVSVRERRVAGFLSRKGYSGSIVWDAVRFATEELAK